MTLLLLRKNGYRDEEKGIMYNCILLAECGYPYKIKATPSDDRRFGSNCS
jgi:hypothetical protein